MKTKNIPERQCIGCRISKNKKDLIRGVKTKEGSIEVDRTGKKNGRGAYLCDDAECFQKARKTNALNRSFKMNIPDEIYEELERQFYETK